MGKRPGLGYEIAGSAACNDKYRTDNRMPYEQALISKKGTAIISFIVKE